MNITLALAVVLAFVPPALAQQAVSEDAQLAAAVQTLKTRLQRLEKNLGVYADAELKEHMAFSGRSLSTLDGIIVARSRMAEEAKPQAREVVDAIKEQAKRLDILEGVMRDAVSGQIWAEIDEVRRRSYVLDERMRTSLSPKWQMLQQWAAATYQTSRQQHVSPASMEDTVRNFLFREVEWPLSEIRALGKLVERASDKAKATVYCDADGRPAGGPGEAVFNAALEAETVAGSLKMVSTYISMVQDVLERDYDKVVRGLPMQRAKLGQAGRDFKKYGEKIAGELKLIEEIADPTCRGGACRVQMSCSKES